MKADLEGRSRWTDSLGAEVDLIPEVRQLRQQELIGHLRRTYCEHESENVLESHRILRYDERAHQAWSALDKEYKLLPVQELDEGSSLRTSRRSFLPNHGPRR